MFPKSRLHITIETLTDSYTIRPSFNKKTQINNWDLFFQAGDSENLSWANIFPPGSSRHPQPHILT